MTSDQGARRVVVCRVGTDRFALPVAAVREVVSTVPLTRLPGVASAVSGLANVRGRLVTALSGPVLLGLPDTIRPDWLVVLNARGGRVGIEVDDVEDLQDAAQATDLPLLDVEELIRPLLAPEVERV